MKLKLAQVKPIATAIAKLLRGEADDWFEFYKLGMIRAAFEPHVKTLGDIEQKMFRKYGTEKDGQITVPVEKQDAFLKEMSALLDEEVDVQFKKVNPNSFRLPEGSAFCYVDFEAIKPILKDSYLEEMKKKYEEEE